MIKSRKMDSKKQNKKSHFLELPDLFVGRVCYGGLAGIGPSAYSKIFAVGGSAKMSASEVNVRVLL